MNPAVRSVVRAGLTRGYTVTLIYGGYHGLMEGTMKEAKWETVSHIMQNGGTMLGTARSEAFREQAGRREACFQLCSRGIDSLVCIGGDGSLTGASILRTEWAEHVETLIKSHRLLETCNRTLDLVGLVGSIDNDLIGFTQTIGADSSLQRIAFSIDCIVSTAASHGRTFIVELMGRSSGYLALASAMITGADWVFIPERPVDHDDWRQTMCNAIRAGRKRERKISLILVAEGAIDSEGHKVSTQDIKEEIENSLKHDVRITTLGHVQRGGSPSAFDRYQGALLGVAAIDEIASNPRGSILSVVGMTGYEAESKPLLECVEATRKVARHLKAREFEKAFEARGSAFSDFWTVFNIVSGPKCIPRPPISTQYPIAMLTVGAPAPGMNHCVRAATRMLLSRGHLVYFVHDGFEGLMRSHFEEAKWMAVSGWASKGGAFLGTGRAVPSDSESISNARAGLQRLGVRALLVIGGYEAYEGAVNLHAAMPETSFVVVPATISKNVPGTEVSIGMDKASNNLATFCDNIKQSALGYTKRVFVVESIGRSCGFQSLFGAITSGAEHVFLPESPPSLQDMQASIDLMRHRFSQSPFQIGLVINSETASNLFTTSFIRELHSKELKNLGVSAREALLSGLQQGGDPSPMDRIFSGRLALAAVDALSEAFASGTPVAVGCGLIGDERHYTPLSQFHDLMDEKNRRPKKQTWVGTMQRVFDNISYPAGLSAGSKAKL